MAGGPEGWFQSARSNFDRILKRKSKGDPCSLIIHYSDVVTEATVAETLAASGSVTQEHASKLASTASRAMRGAIHACRLQRGPKVRR